MEIVLVILAFLFLITGLLGSIVPALPGPPLCCLGLLLLNFSGYGTFSTFFLCLWAVITLVVMIMDNFLPAIMTKKFGGSKAAIIGSIIGIFAGVFFFAPIGLIAGPFIGALAGELINNFIRTQRNKNLNTSESDASENINTGSGNVKALKVAFGAFLAFIFGTGAKLIISAMMIYYAIKAVLN